MKAIDPHWAPWKSLLSKLHFYHLPFAWRITAWFLGFLITMLTILGIFLTQFIMLFEDVDLRSNLQRSVVAMSREPNTYVPYHNYIHYTILNEKGKAIRGVFPANFPSNSPPSYNHLTQVTYRGYTYYYYDVPFQTQYFHGSLRGVTSVGHLEKSLKTVILGFITGGLFLIMVACFTGYFFIRNSLSPIREMTKIAEEISHSKDLSKRIPEIPGDDELHDLSVTFNSMLDSLHESSRREQQFASDVSHDLRTPISVIQMEADFGRQYTTTVDEAKESFSNIFKQTKFMGSLVKQLLELTRLDSTKAIVLTPISLSELVLELISDYQKLTSQQNIKIYGHVESNLMVEADYTLLRRAISNLLDNAVKFTNDRIIISASLKEQQTVVVTVKDNGCGISQDDLSRIWDRSYQAEASRNHNKNKGLGLGLYFVKSVMKLHHGMILAESVVDDHTVFTMLLPKHDEPVEEKPDPYNRFALGERSYID